jgi:hypothetical protein
MSAPDPGLLSINTATVRKQWSLPEIVAGCSHHGILGATKSRQRA